MSHKIYSNMNEDKRSKSLFVGIGLIIVGVVIFLERMNFHSNFISHWLIRWESALILVGVLFMFIRRKIFGGALAILAGSYFLLDELFFLPQNWEIWFFPAALILGGIAFIFQPKCKK